MPIVMPGAKSFRTALATTSSREISKARFAQKMECGFQVAAQNQREAKMVCDASLDSTWARQARRTSAVFCRDFPS